MKKKHKIIKLKQKHNHEIPWWARALAILFFLLLLTAALIRIYESNITKISIITIIVAVIATIIIYERHKHKLY